MTDYISRDGLAEHKFQESELRGMGEGQAYRQGWNDAIDAIIDNEPAADVVEVVRCKDCKWWQPDEVGVIEEPFCTLIVAQRKMDSCPLGDANDYCSYGERREDE